MVDIYLSESEAYFIETIATYYKEYSDNPKKWIKKYWKQAYKNAQSKEIIVKHRAWCKQENIEITPTITLNNSLLPKGYTVEDLKYFL